MNEFLKKHQIPYRKGLLPTRIILTVTKFQVISEQGLTRSLKPVKPYNFPPTPWLLKVNSGSIKVGNHQILPIVVDGGFSSREIPGQSIPIFIPLLSPDEEFEDSNEYEYDLFLDRLAEFEPDGFFGLTFDPKKQTEDQLKAALGFGPSIISLRVPPLIKSSPKEWIPTILEVRKAIPPDIAIYIPRSGYKGLNTLLIAMGIDIIDNTEAFLLALEGFTFKDGFAHTVNEDIKTLMKNNISSISQDFEGIKLSLKQNTIWQRLYREMHVSPTVASFVKYLQKEPIDFSKWGFNRSNKVMFIGDESLRHPEVIAFQNRLRDRYEIPQGKTALVLLPCSAKKPYQHSRSHRLFEKAINRGFEGAGRLVEIWSLTSPMGVVPRELETIYPARTYDIPVSGDWSFEEISSTKQILIDMIRNLPNGFPIIAHVSSGYSPIIEEIKKEREIIISWVDERPTSGAALKKLEETLREYRPTERARFTNKAMTQQWIDTVISQTKWQHGRDFEILTDGWIFKGRPPRPIAIQREKKHYATWDIEKGIVRLFPQAILESNLQTKSWVKFDGTALSGSSLFIPGILEASVDVAPGDEVIIFDSNNEPIAVGEATVSGITMNQARSGVGVKIRKKIEVHRNES